MGMSFDEKNALSDEEVRAVATVCKAEMERSGGDVDVEAVTVAFIQRRNEREEQRIEEQRIENTARESNRRRSLEIENDRRNERISGGFYPEPVTSTPTQIPGTPQFPKNAAEQEAAQRDREFFKDLGKSLNDPGADWGS